MEPPHLCPEEVYDLMCSCWREKMEARPSFETIVLYLEWMLSPPSNEFILASQEFPTIQVVKIFKASQKTHTFFRITAIGKDPRLLDQCRQLEITPANGDLDRYQLQWTFHGRQVPSFFTIKSGLAADTTHDLWWFQSQLDCCSWGRQPFVLQRQCAERPPNHSRDLPTYSIKQQ